MFYKTFFTVIVCVSLLGIASCTAPQETGLVPQTETAAPVVAEDNSPTVITVGDQKLTKNQLEWLAPNVPDERVPRVVKGWLENELLYAEAKKRGITNEPKSIFFAELMRKRAFSQQLVSQVRNAVKISDKQAMEYYEENKETDVRIRKPGFLSFVHVRTESLEKARSVVKRLSAGETIEDLAKELSVHRDGRRGGFARKYMYNTVRKSYGQKFFNALIAAEPNKLIGPIETEDGNYEVGMLENNVLPEIQAFDIVVGKIKAKLRDKAQDKAFKNLLQSLKDADADKIKKSDYLLELEKK